MKTLKLSDLEGKRIEYFDHVDGYGDMSFVADVLRVTSDSVVVLDGDHNEAEVFPCQVVGIVTFVKMEESK